MGAIFAGTSREESLPGDTELRLGQFTELMATAISNTESHVRADRLAEGQASLRRVATLVATESSLGEVFAMVAEEVARVLGDVECALLREEGDGTASIVAISEPSAAQIGVRLSLDDVSVTSLVLREGRLARLDDYARAEGEVAGGARDRGIRSSVGAPIVVGDRVWGVMAVATREARPLAADAEAQLAQFSELVATAIANTQARGEIERLADEQAALRRVATLVAAGVQPAELFSAVSEEVAQLFGTEFAAVGWFDPDGPAVVVVGLASDRDEVAIGTRLELDDAMALTAVYRTGRAARVDRTDWSGASAPVAAIARRLGTACTVASPIVVEGELWGCVTATARTALPLYTEDRLANFTELVGTAIANAESRAQCAAARARAGGAAARRDARREGGAGERGVRRRRERGGRALRRGLLGHAPHRGRDIGQHRGDVGGRRRSRGGTRALDDRVRRPDDAACGGRRGDAGRGLGEHPGRDRASAARSPAWPAQSGARSRWRAGRGAPWPSTASRAGRCRRTPSRGSPQFTELVATAIANARVARPSGPARG